VTPPTIHPGFGEKADDPQFPGAQIRLEIWNISPLKIRIRKGMPICQIIFEEVHGIPEGRYTGQFALQGPG
jgi:dCTP deaminase